MGGSFKIIRHVKEVYLDGKYLGDLPLDAPDRKEYGYTGRRFETVASECTTSKGKVLKNGLKISTELQMICGRLQNPSEITNNYKDGTR